MFIYKRVRTPWNTVTINYTLGLTLMYLYFKKRLPEVILFLQDYITRSAPKQAKENNTCVQYHGFSVGRNTALIFRDQILRCRL